MFPDTLFFFVIRWCCVAKRRMQTPGVVIHGNVFTHISDGFLTSPVQTIDGPFPFQASEEALHWRDDETGETYFWLSDRRHRKRRLTYKSTGFETNTGYSAASVPTPAQLEKNLSTNISPSQKYGSAKTHIRTIDSRNADLIALRITSSACAEPSPEKR